MAMGVPQTWGDNRITPVAVISIRGDMMMNLRIFCGTKKGFLRWYKKQHRKDLLWIRLSECILGCYTNRIRIGLWSRQCIRVGVVPHVSRNPWSKSKKDAGNSRDKGWVQCDSCLLGFIRIDILAKYDSIRLNSKYIPILVIGWLLYVSWHVNDIWSLIPMTSIVSDSTITDRAGCSPWRTPNGGETAGRSEGPGALEALDSGHSTGDSRGELR